MKISQPLKEGRSWLTLSPQPRMKQLFLILFIFVSSTVQASYSKLAQDYLKGVRTGAVLSDFSSYLKSTSYETLALELHSDDLKKTFWLNVYNGLVQEELTLNPSAYKQRSQFFSRKILKLKDLELSLDDIEHGILRRSKSLFSFGYFDHFFVESWEKKLRVETLDFRIHFALNCGAESCPAILFYDETKIDKQLDKATSGFLAGDIEFDPKLNTVKLSRLFFWFNGDFGGHSGIVSIVNRYLDLAMNKNTTFAYKKYDWDLSLSKFQD